MKKMKIWPKNDQAYSKNRSCVVGVARNATHIALEYVSVSGKFRDLVVVEFASLKIWHTCPAIGHGKPCWHLAAIADICGWGLPLQVNVIPERFSGDLPGLRDTTNALFGRPGDFQIVRLESSQNETNKPESKNTKTISEVPGLSPEDAWLQDYHLPDPILKKVLTFRGIRKNNLTPEQAARVPKPQYISSGRELVASIAALLYGEGGTEWEAPLLVGPKGSGKSTLAETLAAILHMPVQKLFGGVDVNAEYLLGSKTLAPLENGVDIITEAKLRAAAKTAGIEIDSVLEKLRSTQLRVAFEPGVLLKAVQDGEMVILDEVNMVVPEVTSLLHGLLDWQKTLSAPGLGAVNAHPSFRLVGAMNHGYSGTKDLNEAFQDRFRSVFVPHLSKGALTNLLVRETDCSPDTAKDLAELFGKLAARVENGDLSERCLSIRSLIRAIREHQDGVGSPKEVTLSVLTEGLSDNYEAEQVKDVVDACLA